MNTALVYETLLWLVRREAERDKRLHHRLCQISRRLEVLMADQASVLAKLDANVATLTAMSADMDALKDAQVDIAANIADLKAQIAAPPPAVDFTAMDASADAITAKIAEVDAKLFGNA